MSETKPGDGRTNPFGNGMGGARGGNVAGVDFTKNPGGSSAGKTGGRRFDNEMAPPQGPREAVADRSSADAAPGGLLPLIQAAPQDAGVGSIGNGQKPFKLNGG